MMREQIYDQTRQHQKNITWYLAWVENQQVFAHDLQLLLDSVIMVVCFSYIAHQVDPAAHPSRKVIFHG
jgi:membrane-anchored protein YejM (alkaline phosphatase superfamily)